MAVLMYAVASAVANHWPHFAFVFGGRPSVHIKEPKLSGIDDSIFTEKHSDEFF